MKPFATAEIKSILLVQLGPFGDVLLNTSYLNVLRRKFPHSRIDFLVSKPYDSVLYRHPALDHIVSFPKKKGLAYVGERIRTFYRVWKNHYDLIIDQQCGTGSGQIVMFSHAKYRLGFENSKFAIFYNMVASRGPKRYSASTKFDVLAPLGIVEEPYELYYYVMPESREYIQTWLNENKLEDRSFVVFSPGSPAERKVWKLENFARLADMIIENHNLKIVILWAPDELKDAERVISLMHHSAVMAPKTNLNQGAALLEHSRLLICNDGGINHISVATKTPSLAMFGPTSPLHWCPGKVFPIHDSLSNPQAYTPEDKGFGISVEEAYIKANNLLDL
ncbi:MAG: glycosyltransferase family 9 protein [Candidatus Cloacimonetes bacterium]|jgi:heptosyltransferase-1|nr:glycosyltransferase family 9 protein [Candidatus Cloacimonadota bacterium]MCK9434291.1 glycosyltransferase family 9 protein [Candidatus Cloacimonadota bacterium]MDD4233462.1 glycosyltransferase family 9 protein [Candidatus Cloacimonadota bacterium]